MNQTKKAERIAKFRRHMIVYLGLALSSADNLSKIASKILDDLGTLQPEVDQLEEYVMDLRSSDYSWSYICNKMLAIERYMEFIGVSVKFGRPKKPKRAVKNTLTEAEVAVLIDASKTARERALLALLCCSAIRNQELCDLKVGNVDIANNEVRVENGKGARERIVFITGGCARILSDYIHDSDLSERDYLFRPTRGNQRMRPHVVRRTLLRIAARTKIKKHIHPHLLRHSWATNMIDRGANPRTVQSQLGHRFLETTMIYVESRPQRVKNECAVFAPAYV